LFVRAPANKEKPQRAATGDSGEGAQIGRVHESVKEYYSKKWPERRGFNNALVVVTRCRPQQRPDVGFYLGGRRSVCEGALVD
jgi:hypothetical protein